MCEHDSTGDTPCEPCGLRVFERNRYFDGKLLVARDFEDEQDYLRGKDRLHNSLLHGHGVVCGLKLEQHPQEACRNHSVVLNPGLAYDCCGHEIVVPQKGVVKLRDAIEKALRDKSIPIPPPNPVDVFVRLLYQEKDVEQVPALLDECGCGEGATEFNRTRETWTLRVDLDPPEDTQFDPDEAKLSWRHTLTTSFPQALAVDRDRERLYVAEWNGTQAFLRTFDTRTHRLIAQIPLTVPTLTVRPGTLAVSSLGDVLYVGVHDADTALILLLEPAVAEGQTGKSASVLVSDDQGIQVAGLAVSQRDESLFAALNNGKVLRWSSEALRKRLADQGSGTLPTTGEEDLRNVNVAPGLVPADLVQTPNGSWMVVADRTQPRLVVLNLPQFGDPSVPIQNRMKAFQLAPGDVPSALDLNFSGDRLYVVCAEPGSAQRRSRLYRFTLEDQPALDTFLPDVNAPVPQRFASIPLTKENTLPIDVVVTPRDRWAFVLRRLFDASGQALDRGDVIIVDIEQLATLVGKVDDQNVVNRLLRPGTDTDGGALFEHLAFLGQRMYVAGNPDVLPPQETAGRISIIDVDEATCGSFIQRTVEKCTICPSPEGVVIASILGYKWDKPIVNDPDPDPTKVVNVLNNFTHRRFLPSTSVLHQVIECMLAKGINEGVPGPRGPAGPAGPQGSPGPRGPGITEAQTTTLPAGQPATARLEPILGDPENDQRLLLGIPTGAAGPPGPRGPGITEVAINSLPPTNPPTARLEPILGDPENDQRLVLGIPVTPPPDFNHVVNASWHHDEVMDPTKLIDFLRTTGLVVAFSRNVKLDTLHRRSVRVLARVREQPGDLLTLVCECEIPDLRIETVRTKNVSRSVEWLIGETPTTQGFDLAEQDGAGALGVRVTFDQATLDRIRRLIERNLLVGFRIVLHGAWILDERELALDGDPIWPGVPDKPSGNKTEAGDWVSLLHVKVSSPLISPREDEDEPDPGEKREPTPKPKQPRSRSARKS